MKKHWIYMLTIVLFLACNQPINSADITPPDWILGSWSEKSGNLIFFFMNNEIGLETYIDGNGTITIFANNSSSYTISELTNNNNEYIFAVIYEEINLEYRFIKVTENLLNYTKLDNESIVDSLIQLSRDN